MIARNVSIERVVFTVALDYEVTPREILSLRRARRVSTPRQVAMYLACQMTSHSTVAIGRMLSRDHSTVLYAHGKIAGLRSEDPEFDQRLRRIEERLQPVMPLREEIQLAFLDGPLFDWLHDPTRPRATLRQLEAA